MTPTIEDRLYDMSEEIVSLVDEKIDDISKEEIPHTLIEVNEFDYSTVLDVGLGEVDRKQNDSSDSETSLHIRDEEITKEVWSSQDIYENVVSELQERREYEELLDMIEERATINSDENELSERDPRQTYFKYIYNFSEECLNDDVGERTITNYISAFTSEIHGSPIQYDLKTFVSGLGVSVETIDITEELEIRQPTAEDLDQEIRMEFPWYDIHARPIVGSTPTAIVNYSLKANSTMDIQEEIDEILSTLRLYNVGTVQFLGREETPASPFREGSKFWDRNPNFPPFGYVITEEDEEDLQSFFSELRPILRKHVLSSDNENYLSIAYERYENSIIDDSSPGSRIVSAIMALEAMYLSENEEGELSDRLAQRAALIVNFHGRDEPIEVYRKLKKAYAIRSNYVHGSKIATEDRKGLPSLQRQLLNYTRISLVSHLQIQEKWTKSDFISKIDNAVLDTSARESLEEEYSDLVSIY